MEEKRNEINGIVSLGKIEVFLDFLKYNFQYYRENKVGLDTLTEFDTKQTT